MRPDIRFSNLKNAALAWKLQSSACHALISIVFIWCKVQMIFFFFLQQPPLLSVGLHQFTTTASSINWFFFPSSPKSMQPSPYIAKISVLLYLYSPLLTSPLVPFLPSFFSPPLLLLLPPPHLPLLPHIENSHNSVLCLTPHRSHVALQPAGTTCFEIFLLTLSPSSHRPPSCLHMWTRICSVLQETIKNTSHIFFYPNYPPPRHTHTHTSS